MTEIKLTDKDLAKAGGIDEVEDAGQHDDGVIGLTEEELIIEKKLVRKIDFIIMPIILLVYLLNWIDRYVFVHSMECFEKKLDWKKTCTDWC